MTRHAVAALAAAAIYLTVTTATATAGPSHPDVPFARRTVGALKLDVYRPDRTTNRPIIVLVHGGGWWSGDKSDMDTVASDLSAQGYVVASINYRLACGTPSAPRRAWGTGFNLRHPLCGAYVPHQVADVQEAVAFMRRSARRFGGDPARIALAGSSAGGHLSLLAAATAPPRSRAQAVVSWSGPSSNRFIDAQVPQRRGSINAAYTNAIGCTLAACPEDWDAAAPVKLITPRTPRFAVFASGSQREPQVSAFSLTAFDRHIARLGWKSVVAIARGNCHSRECFHTPVVSRGGGTVWSRTLTFLDANVGSRRQ